MFRNAAMFLACLALLAFASPAKASSISVCAETSGVLHCDFDFNGATSGVVAPITDGAGYDPDWLVGYSFLMNQGASYTTGTVGVNSVVVLNASGASLYSSADSNFGAVSAAALALAPISGISLADGQIVGTPFFPGAQSNGGVGIVDFAGVGWSLPGIIWPGGSSDSISVINGAVNPPEVPEPATMTLLGIGGAVAGFRKWRAGRKAA